MRIRLINFRCYEDNTFDFGSNGLALLSGPSGKGKCLGENTEVLLYTGIPKMVQDIVIGDKLMGDDSRPRSVLSTCSGYDDLYEIIPEYGDSYIVNSKHILTLKNNMDSSHSYDISLENYMALSEQNSLTYHVMVEYPEKIVDIDPYMFGVLFVFCNKDNDSEVPYCYRTGSIKQRLLLLAGIIDSIGIVSENSIILCMYNKVLINNIKYIALSVGLMAVKYESSKKDEVIIYGYGLVNIPIIKNKEKLKKNKQTKNATDHKFSVVHKGKGKYYGFELDGNGRFLLADYKVTHNSSILMGIYFALFGSGTKVTAYGKTACTVEFEFDGMKILRTKRPNRVVVNDVYEDATAQEIINKKFGDTFDVTGYIAQNALNSFILMSPIDKLAFLEKFAFRDVDLAKIKSRCKSYINKLHDELLGITSQLDMAKKVLDEIIQPNEVKFPIICKQNQREKVINNEEIRLKNCHTLIRKTKKSKQFIYEELNDLKILKATVHARQDQYDDIICKIDKLQKHIGEQVYDGDDKLEEYENKLENYLSQKEIIIMEDKLLDNIKHLEKMKEDEKQSLRIKITEINDNLWQEYSKEELKQVIIDMKQYVKDIEKIENLREESEKCNVDIKKYEKYKLDLIEHMNILKLKKEILEKYNKQSHIYSCPSCNTKLRFYNKSLSFADNEYVDITPEEYEKIQLEIPKLTMYVTKLQNIIPVEENKLERKKELEEQISNILCSYEDISDIEETKRDIESLLEYQASQNELEKQKKNLEHALQTDKFSSSYQNYTKIIEELKKNIINMQKKIIIDIDQKIDEEELRYKIVQQKQIKAQLENLYRSLKSLEKEKYNCENILNNVRTDHINKYKEIKDENNLEKILNDHDTILSEQQEKLEKHEKNIKQIELWKKYQEELENYSNWEKKVKNLEIDEKEARNKYAAATQLKDKFLEAESISMINIIDSINSHARIYLDIFFSEHPISVQLQAFKETKKNTKPSINITIEYKGMEADLNMLSGGELSRVILAYTLALAEMFNTPLLLLDECTASLDQELASTVFEAIKDNFNGKMALVIAHQCVCGNFDKIVQI